MTLIRGAAAGNRADRSVFAQRYLPVARACIAARWRGTPWIEHLDDAVQDVFVECFRDRGMLQSFDTERGGGFRAFLYGVARNVTRRFERDHARQRSREVSANTAHLRGLPSDDDNFSVVFDRSWAESLVQLARERMAQRAVIQGAAGRRRVELLRQRFESDLPIREIAARWRLPAETVHREYRKARQEFQASLRQVVAYHSHAAAEDLDAECERLLLLLQ